MKNTAGRYSKKNNKAFYKWLVEQVTDIVTSMNLKKGRVGKEMNLEE